MGSMAWKVLAGVAAAAATAVADRGIRSAWKATTGDEPPSNPTNPDVNWREAVTWALLSGAVIGIARLAAQRKAASYYRNSSGDLPKALAGD